MNTSDALNLALEGLDEGYRVIARALNLALEIRCKQLCFAVERRSTDSLASARSKMRASLPKIMHIDPLRFAEYQPWTLGYITGSKDHPANISLVGGYSGEVSDVIAFLVKMELWTEVQWRELIVDPVSKHHSKWASWLKKFGVAQAKEIDPWGVVRDWIATPQSEGGPSVDQLGFVKLLLEKAIPMVPNDISKAMGKNEIDWVDPLENVKTLKKVLNKKLRERGSVWEIKQNHGTFVIYHKLAKLIYPKLPNSSPVAP